MLTIQVAGRSARSGKRNTQGLLLGIDAKMHRTRAASQSGLSFSGRFVNPVFTVSSNSPSLLFFTFWLFGTEKLRYGWEKRHARWGVWYYRHCDALGMRQIQALCQLGKKSLWFAIKPAFRYRPADYTNTFTLYAPKKKGIVNIPKSAYSSSTRLRLSQRDQYWNAAYRRPLCTTLIWLPNPPNEHITKCPSHQLYPNSKTDN